MVGYKSKKFLAESREPDADFGFDLVPDVSLHYRETSDMIMEKADENLFYRLRHLKTFKDITKNTDTIWRYKWPDGGNIQVYDKTTEKTLFELGHDLQLAEYLVSLHNMSKILIKEVESKYVD
jgi:hypothetical protein